MHADIHERPKVSHVGNHTLEGHADLEIANLMDVVAKLRSLELRPGVTAGLLQLRDDVAQGRLADRVVDVAADVDTLDQLRVADELRARDPEVGGHPLDEGVAFGVDGRAIEGLGALAHAQKARGLLEGLGPEPADRVERGPTLERAAALAVGDDLLGQRVADPGHVAEQRRARGVELDADPVDAALDHLVELAPQQGLLDVVLVLTHADRLGIDLDQLGEGVLEPPGDRDRSAHGQVEVGELIARDLGSRVDAGPGLADADDDRARALGELEPGDHPPGEGLGLAPAGPVADRDRPGLVALDKGGELARGPVFVPDREDRRGLDELAGRVDGRALAPGPEARINADHGHGPERRGEQQVGQVVGEDLDGLAVGPLLELDADVDLDADPEAPAHGLVDRRAELLGEGRGGVDLHHRLEPGLDQRRLDPDRRAQHALFLAPPDRQIAVRGDLGRGLGPVKPVGEFVRGLDVDAGHRAGLEHAAFGVVLADGRAGLGLLDDGLDHDVAGARERGLGVGHVELGVDERDGLALGRAVARLGEDPGGERSEAPLVRDRGLGPSLGLEREVEILERLLGGRRAELGLERGGQLGLVADRREDRRATILELDEVAAALFDRADLDLVEATGRLFSVARDEGHRRAFGEQADDGEHAAWRQLQLFGEGWDGVELFAGGGGHGRRRACCLRRRS
ncbi:hypothetical protein ENSA5_43380 [Enhygromyxa salina]|uniref:Uncharacterized protein n=1 Tax=Enhygromyxa salina TaxID=215803 RepID=A0A2S9XKA9_9BACT|nr:hypothetical protein ENSA5_43380 [Enhygromyxa salina]